MEPTDTLDALLRAARRAGADHADAMMLHATSKSVTLRQARLEDGEHADSVKVGLRVFVGQRAASVSTTSTSDDGFDALAAHAIAMARTLPANPYAGLASTDIKGQLKAQDLCLSDDDTHLTTTHLKEAALRAEQAALYSNAVTNSNGASASAWHGTTAFADSDGFSGQYRETIFGLSVSVIAGQGEAMQRDYASHVARHWSALDQPEKLGAEAAFRAGQRLNPRKPATGAMPVVFDPRVSSSLLGHLAGALNGAAIARGTSFLAKEMGAQILSKNLNVIDDPTRRSGLASRLFDAEGVRPQKLELVKNGSLQHWFLDHASALQLGLSSNGCARRAPGGTPSPSSSNLYLDGGTIDPKDLISDISEGVYVTEMIGSTVNMLTGDYSRGASGFMIRNGEICEPVAGLTVAGHLGHMFKTMRAANDLTFRRSVNAPTIRIDGLNVAGE